MPEPKLAILFALCSVLHAQAPLPRATTAATSASLSGFVRDESNNPVQATVTIATQGLRQSQPTAADGSFSFSNLKTGMFFACAVPPPGTNGQHYVDSCLWQDRHSVYVPLAPGRPAKTLSFRFNMDIRWMCA